MEKELVVTVTADDIISGVRGKPDACPIARAIDREYPIDNGWWSVQPSFITRYFGVEADLKVIRWKNPKTAFRWVCDFDNGNTVEPFTFTAVLEEKE